MKLGFDYFSRHLVLLLLALSLGNFALAQRTVRGTVTDAETGEPLIGANVLVEGTSTGTITDLDGTFSLEVPEGATALEISYTGYQTARVGLGASNVYDVALQPGTALDEVVVVGYGTKKAKEVTSSVASVKAEDFNQGNVNDPTQLLQGKVAGLTISRPGSDPNAGFTMRLRGLSTVSQNQQPLVIIDGVPGASLQSVDPADIATIDVLKDGSAAAIYGTRASAGVILITTKSGERGRVKAEYNGQFATSSMARQVPVMSASEYVQYGGPDADGDPNTNTDWYDAISRTGLAHVHNLSLSGGSALTSYRASFNYRSVDGIARFNGFDQINGRLNLNQKALNERLNLSVNLSATTRDAEFGFTEAFRYATVYKPTAPITSSDPEFEQYDGYFQEVLFDYFNPVAIIEQNLNEGRFKRLIGGARADLTITEGLTAGAFYSIQRESDIYGEYYDKNSFFRGKDRNGLARRSTEDRTSQLFETTIHYTTNFGNTEMKLLGGYSYQDFVTEGFGIEGGNFLSDVTTYNNIGSGLDFPNGLGSVWSYKNSHKLIAFFGRASFNIDDTYFLDATLRREGSSRFGANNKWGNFPAVSAGVNITNLTDISGVDNLKLRVGYGVTGSIPGESYLSLLRLAPGSKFFFNGAYVPSYGPASNANPDLKWETKSEFDVGLDFALMDYKLTGSIDYYNRTTRDLLLYFPVPVPPNLFPFTWVNIGELQSKGLELALNAQVVQNDNMNWESGLTFATFNTTLVSLSNEDLQFGEVRYIANVGAPGLNNIMMVRVKEGEELGQIWGPVYEGVDDSGNWIFQDVDGDGTVEVEGFEDDDNTVIGNGLPDFELGWNNTFTFGNWDLNFFFRGAFGHSLVNMFRVFYETLDPSGIGTWNRVKTKYFNENLTAPNKFSSFHVEDASFVKLDNATLGYNFDLPEGSAFSKVRLYVSGQNLLTITGYSGVDPEVRFVDTGSVDNGGRSNQADPLAPGIDRRNTYFLARTITFGVNLGF
ncbi:MAG: SusC/RagA family TonB-linked outer membrane protein [Bacteroidetes bacterium]|nr:MAG: SusC/RagA family TonB-linked outer membrane protein [Bacteroidota bacterium]